MYKSIVSLILVTAAMALDLLALFTRYNTISDGEACILLISLIYCSVMSLVYLYQLGYRFYFGLVNIHTHRRIL